MITTILISIAIYIISFIAMYKWIQIAHSKDGIYSKLDIDPDDFLMTIIPIINTLSAILMWIFYLPRPRQTNYNKFFNIKR